MAGYVGQQLFFSLNKLRRLRRKMTESAWKCLVKKSAGNKSAGTQKNPAVLHACIMVYNRLLLPIPLVLMRRRPITIVTHQAPYDSTQKLDSGMVSSKQSCPPVALGNPQESGVTARAKNTKRE
jgi:hypothetical protein